MDWKLELLLLPVSDPDRARAFYVDQLGFTLDVDHAASPEFRVIQVTPPGSACSFSFGIGITQMAPGSIQGTHLVVRDIEAARDYLTERGVEASEIFHFDNGQRAPGTHPQRRDYGSYCSFSDPDGNGWLVQEVKYERAEG